jgi:hypothetical protein
MNEASDSNQAGLETKRSQTHGAYRRQGKRGEKFYMDSP